jgi:hypothetical protein
MPWVAGDGLKLSAVMRMPFDLDVADAEGEPEGPDDSDDADNEVDDDIEDEDE